MVVSRWWINSLRWQSLRDSGRFNQSGFCMKRGFHLHAWEHPTVSIPHGHLLQGNTFTSREKLAIPFKSQFRSGPLRSVSFTAGQLTVVGLCEMLELGGQEVILLDSQQTRGQFRILGLVLPEQTLKLAFNVHNHLLTFSVGTRPLAKIHFSDTSEVWSLLHEILQIHKVQEIVRTPSPFCGGLMGYISYEAGLDTIAVHSSCRDSPNKAPDMNFALI